MGPVQQRLLGVYAGLRLHVDFVLPLGMDAVSLRSLGVRPQPRLVLGARWMEQMVEPSTVGQCASGIPAAGSA